MARSCIRFISCTRKAFMRSSDNPLHHLHQGMRGYHLFDDVASNLSFTPVRNRRGIGAGGYGYDLVEVGKNNHCRIVQLQLLLFYLGINQSRVLVKWDADSRRVVTVSISHCLPLFVECTASLRLNG